MRLTEPFVTENKGTGKDVPQQSTKPYDPTKQLTDEYLKTNISMYDNRGKYFDSYLFNQKFDEYIRKKDAERLAKQEALLYDLNKMENTQIPPYKLPLDKMMIGLKNEWFELYDNMKNGNYKQIFTFDSNKLFYFGISFVLIYILFVMLVQIFE